MLSIQDAGQIINALGDLGLALIVIWTGARGVWIWAKVRDDEREFAQERLEEMRKDRDEWKSLAQTATTSAATSLAQIQNLTSVVESLTVAVGKKLRP